MPNRVIKESIKRSPQIDSLTWFEEVVFYRLIVSADDYGCMDGRTILLRNELFPTKETVTKKSIEDAIEKLVSVGLLCRYTESGMPYLFFPTWEKHQRIRNKHRKFPEPPADILTANRCQMAANCQPESESNPNPNPNPIRADALEGIDGELRKKLEEWLKYKSERRESYKPTGLHSLVEQVKKHRKQASDAQICALIDECMANGWRGIIWDKLKKTGTPQNASAKTGSYKSLDAAELEELIRRDNL